MGLTGQQQRIVDHRGGNLLVSASAGSGKTETLARRCMALLTDAEAPCGVDELLVVTFTRAAAAELRSRLARMLAETLAQAQPAPQRAHLRQQQALLDTADIGTIDAWCFRLLREHYSAAGVDPAFTVISPEDAELLRAGQLDELMLWVCTTPDELADGARRWIECNVNANDRFLRVLLDKLSRFEDHLLDPASWRRRQIDVYSQPEPDQKAAARRRIALAIARECEFQCTQLAALADAGSDERTRAVLDRYRDALTEWRAQLGDPQRLNAVVSDIGSRSLFRGRRSSADAPFLDGLQKKWFEARLKKPWSYEHVAGLIEDAPAAAERALTLLRLAERFQQGLEAAKRRRGVLEFSDLLRAALRVLGNAGPAGDLSPTPLARKLRARYAHVVVDEYQDTSRLQVELLRLVTRAAPEPGNRFMVGDIKQSIYGFREAEPRLFNEQVAAFDQGREPGVVQHLSDNFRSHGDLLDGLNAIFANLFDAELGGSAYGDKERLVARRGDLPNPALDQAPRIELHLIDEPKRSAHAVVADPQEHYEREARLAAERIAGLFDAGAQVQHPLPDGRPELRPLRLGDIVILLRSATFRAGQLAGELRRLGVRAVATGRESILDAQEVVDVRNVLALLCNRRQDIPLAAYLRSPYAGLSAADLLAIRRIRPKGEFSLAVLAAARGEGDIPAVLRERLTGALGRLDAWQTAARELDPPALVQRILRETQAELLARARPLGAHRVALIESFLNLVRQASAGASGGLADFVRRLSGLARQESAPSATPTVSDDAVRIMTIHAAKGLEFPVVLLLDAGARFPDHASTLECDEDEGLGLECADYPSRRVLRTVAHPLAKRIRRQRELDEELRLLYVAATRAREKLIVIGHRPPGAWDAACLRHPPGVKPLLLARQTADSLLEWLLIGVAAGGAHQPAPGRSALVSITTHDAGAFAERPPPRAARGTTPGAPVDAAWVSAARELLSAAPDLRLAQHESVVSVSRLKQRSAGDLEADAPSVAGRAPEALARPAWLADQADARAAGVATHRLLQYVRLAALASRQSLREEIERLLREGRLTPREARLIRVDALTWFAATPDGRWLIERAHLCRREVAFVYGWPVGVEDERQVVRGVIDCLVEEPESLVLLDYKTDHVRSADSLAERTRGYSTQVRLYARAAEALFGRPVRRALLVYLRQRQVIEVPPGEIERI